MRLKFSNLLIILTVCLFSLATAQSLAYAQNFSGTDRDEYSDDLLMEEQIEQILINEGVPTYSTTDNIPGSDSKYTLGPEDVISIEVLRHPEVSGTYLINSEGKIQYGFVGDIELSGMTKKETTTYVQETLSKYIVSPEVTVTIVGYNSKVVYVVGEVGRPGKIFMRGDTITIREALVQAALPLLSAKARKSVLITPSDDGRPIQKRVNVHRLLYEGDLRENFVMRPGDTLYIPATFLTKTMRAIQPVASPIGTAAGTGRTVTTGF